jgi:hypothetical protein
MHVDFVDVGGGHGDPPHAELAQAADDGVAHRAAGQAGGAGHLLLQLAVERGAAKEAQRGAHQRHRGHALGLEFERLLDHRIDHLGVAARRDLAETEPAGAEADALAVQQRAVHRHRAGGRGNDQAQMRLRHLSAPPSDRMTRGA